eukprot:9467353-Pyramimonas_sp.AAC.1
MFKSPTKFVQPTESSRIVRRGRVGQLAPAVNRQPVFFCGFAGSEGSVEACPSQRPAGRLELSASSQRALGRPNEALQRRQFGI